MALDIHSSDIAFHPSWPAPAQSLLRRAIDRHGGWSLWSRLVSVTVNLVSLRGALPWLKGYGRTFQLARSLTTFPKEGRTEWRQERLEPLCGVFDRGDMRLYDTRTGEIRAESRHHRQTFRGLRKNRRWNALDAHYFFGYAFASYCSVPFILPSLPFAGTAVGVARGERLNGVSVEYPAGADVHSRFQRYLFDASGLLRRNDYVAGVVGRWAIGVHLWEDFTDVSGLPLPARRSVFFRLGRWALPFPTILGATFDRFGVQLAS